MLPLWDIKRAVGQGWAHVVEEIQAIDVIEKLKEYLLGQAPSLEPELIRLKETRFEDRSLSFYKTQFLATVLNINDRTSSGKRKLRKLFSHIEDASASPPDVLDESVVSEHADTLYQSLRLPKREALKRAFEKFDSFAQASGTVDNAFGTRLRSCMTLAEAVAFLSEHFVLLHGLRAYKFLQAIDHPVVVPDHARQQFLYRLGWIQSKGKSAACYLEFFRVCDKVAQLAGESLLSINRIIGLYSGGERTEVTGLAICIRRPRCSRCVATAYCAYHRYQAGPARVPRVSIKEWAEDDRPREKYKKFGPLKLSNAELLSIILRAGAGETSAIDLGRRLLQKFKDLEGLDNASLGEICSIKGIGEAKAIEIKAALELGKRLLNRPLASDQQISSSMDVYKSYRLRFVNIRHETFFMLLMNTKNHVIKEVMISKGNLSSSLVHPREVFKEAIKESAASVIFLHNHPSGDPKPSHDDIAITHRLKEVGDLIGIRLVDHIIIGAKRYYSFADEGIIQHR
jgi:DNA repair protein RadC